MIREFSYQIALCFCKKPNANNSIAQLKCARKCISRANIFKIDFIINLNDMKCLINNVANSWFNTDCHKTPHKTS